jgi:hypothetical protein
MFGQFPKPAAQVADQLVRLFYLFGRFPKFSVGLSARFSYLLRPFIICTLSFQTETEIKLKSKLNRNLSNLDMPLSIDKMRSKVGKNLVRQ